MSNTTQSHPAGGRGPGEDEGVSVGRHRSFWLDGSLGAMAAALHSPIASHAGVPRVLLVPPLLHEQHRSHRFYCEVATCFASLGMTCLRFCYSGTSDSQGEGKHLGMHTMLADVHAATGELALKSQRGPLFLFGFRSAALALGAWLQKPGSDAIAALWDPVCVGDDWLAGLREQDRLKRDAVAHLDGAEASPAVHDDHLMGLPASTDFQASVAGLSWPDATARLRAWAVLPAAAACAQRDWHRRFDLPATVPPFETSVLMDPSLTFTPAMERTVTTLGRAMLDER